MESNNLFKITLAAFLLMTSLPIFALRCANQVIAEGDPQIKVLQFCGNPTAKTSEQVGQVQSININGIKNSRFEVVTKEIWTYNFGSQNFIYVITFDGAGNVEKIRTNGYGY